MTDVKLKPRVMFMDPTHKDLRKEKRLFMNREKKRVFMNKEKYYLWKEYSWETYHSNNFTFECVKRFKSQGQMTQYPSHGHYLELKVIAPKLF